jgi:hypothetical protein
MKSRVLRLTLIVFMLATIAASAYLVWKDQAGIRQDVEAGRALETRAIAALHGLLELRSGQMAYVAAGQSEQFWTGKVASSLSAVRATLSSLQHDAISGAARASLDEAVAALQDFEQIDRRARALAVSGQKLLAADIVFSDGLELTGAAAKAVEQARTQEAEERDAAVGKVERRQAAAAGVSAGAAVLVALLLAPLPKRREDELLAQEHDANKTPSPLDTFEIKTDRTPKPVAPPAPAPPAFDFSEVASLCTDFARISDIQSLPLLLERAATALDASGIIIWIADPEGNELTPILGHGYPDQMLSRIGRLDREAHNVTASAFRTALVQTMPADTVSNGAIAAPLMTQSGCVGVMAAEVRNDGEKQPERLAAASIIAAQLATLVGPPTSRSQKAEAAR